MADLRRDLGSDRRNTLRRLVGVYDADHTRRGELAYAIGHLLGRRTCDLCAITHRGVRPKAQVEDLVASIGVPFAFIHRDQQPRGMATVTDGALACVVGQIGRSWEILVDRERLAACEGRPDAMVAEIRNEIRRRRLHVGQGA